MITKTIIINYKLSDLIFDSPLFASIHMTHSLLATAQHTYNTNRSYTSLNDPELTSIIAHINEEHLDELLGFLNAFTPLSTDELGNTDVQLSAVYAEGIALQTQPKPMDRQPTDGYNTTKREQSFFIDFAAPITQLDDLQTQYILLKQRADKKLGKKTIKLTKQTFSVKNRYHVSDNMLRLELSLPTLTHDSGATIPVPLNEAGYAYLFDLEHNAITANNPNGSTTESTVRPARPHCYYTLRKAWHADGEIRAWVDVFLHGDTPGGNWANSLQTGHTVITKREVPEKTEHLDEGQAVLIVDETSMPTAARLLELWNNPKPPLVVCVTNHAADQRYFDEVKLGNDLKNNDLRDNDLKNSVNSTDNHFTVLPIVTDQIRSGKGLASLIDNTLNDYLSEQPLKVDKVWGALEAGTAKALRPLLRGRFDLSRAEVVVKVYWRQD